MLLLALRYSPVVTSCYLSILFLWISLRITGGPIGYFPVRTFTAFAFTFIAMPPLHSRRVRHFSRFGRHFVGVHVGFRSVWFACFFFRDHCSMLYRSCTRCRRRMFHPGIVRYWNIRTDRGDELRECAKIVHHVFFGS